LGKSAGELREDRQVSVQLDPLKTTDWSGGKPLPDALDW
jgi:hypothetical protein